MRTKLLKSLAGKQNKSRGAIDEMIAKDLKEAKKEFNTKHFEIDD